MGKATEEFVATIRSTGRGGDHYGTCDQCGKVHEPASETG